MNSKEYYYYYEPDDKYYIKKTLIKNGNHDLNGKPLMPAHTTTVIPPENVLDGFIPVFDIKTQNWEIKKDDFWHCSVDVYPEYFSNFPVNELPQLYTFTTLGIMDYDKDIRLNILFKDLPHIANGLLIMMRFISRINIINKKTHELYQKHAEWLTPSIIHTIDSLIEYKLIGEDIIHQLKKLLDEFITAIYIHDNYEEIKHTHKLEIDDYGKYLFSNKNTPIIAHIKAVINFEKYKIFLEAVKELDNGFKHNLTPAESDSEIGLYAPTIILYRYKYSSLNSITKYNVYVGGLIDQCNKFIYEYLKINCTTCK